MCRTGMIKFFYLFLFKIAECCWLYYLSKFTDFFETCIFVMLKRFDMINLYHVAHHSIMPVSVWWGVKFMAGGNCLIHKNI